MTKVRNSTNFETTKKMEMWPFVTIIFCSLSIELLWLPLWVAYLNMCIVANIQKECTEKINSVEVSLLMKTIWVLFENNTIFLLFKIVKGILFEWS